MALAFVGGKTAAFAGTASAQAIALTGLAGGLASSPSPGDIVIVAYAVSSTIEREIGAETAGYVEEQRLYASSPGNDANLWAGWKIMGASPDGSVTVSATDGSGDAGAVAIHVWRGVDQTTPFDVAETTDSGNGTPQPNPPSIAPISQGSVAIAIGAGAAASLADFTSPDLSNFVTTASPDDNDAAIGMGSIAWDGSGTVSPAQFGGGNGSNSNRSWAAITLALRPQTSAHYSLAADSGGYVLPSAAATLRKAVRMAAAVGGRTLSGPEVRMARGYILAAGAGLHALIGTSAAFRKALRIAADAGAHGLGATIALLQRGHAFVAGAGTHLLSGGSALFAVDLRIFTAEPPDPERILILSPISRTFAASASPGRAAMTRRAGDRGIVLTPLRRARQA